MHATKVGEIGEVVHLAKSGRLVVKLNPAGAELRAGELLTDASGKRVGRIAEFIGPVSSPYASVIPMTDKTGRLAGTAVFSGGQMRPRNFGGSRSSSKKKRARR
ncbi:MAG TPA: Gar1/Naf1 family protein [Nitrososphaera sp.]|nr:Gar1/Naf1 family protein [Nitrososphaera sp.]